MFLRIAQNSQENIFVGAYFLLKLKVCSLGKIDENLTYETDYSGR